MWHGCSEPTFRLFPDVIACKHVHLVVFFWSAGMARKSQWFTSHRLKITFSLLFSLGLSIYPLPPTVLPFCFCSSAARNFLYMWTLSSKMAPSFRSLYVERRETATFGFFDTVWERLDYQSEPKTELPISFDWPSLYEVRVMMATNINGTLWLNEVDRSFFHVNKGKGQGHTKRSTKASRALQA